MTGIELIAAERERQIHSEGWTSNHDAQHSTGELAIAGACYALRISQVHLPTSVNSPRGLESQIDFTRPLPNQITWPWDNEWYKPTPENRVRQLVKAGALIAAEIDRLQRLDSPHPTPVSAESRKTE